MIWRPLATCSIIRRPDATAGQMLLTASQGAIQFIKFNSRNEVSKCVSMTWWAISIVVELG